MKSLSPLLISLSFVSLAACSPAVNDGSSSSSSDMSSISDETNNVLYRGMLETSGTSIYMQGTHKLTLDDGRFLLLESDMINLDHYVGHEVEVFGSVRPTVEAGGQIMRVESVRTLDESSSSSSVADSSTSMSSVSSTTMSVASTAASSAPVSSAAAVSSLTQASSIDSMTQTSSAPAASADLQAKAEVMAKAKMGAENWTQQYCSPQIGFCIPVHKNWWFKSFGTTSSALWRLEIGPSEMNNIGEGPITVELVSGATASDGQVSTQGSSVVGIRSWTGNRHFEIRGPAVLDAAIRYITEHLSIATQ